MKIKKSVLAILLGPILFAGCMSIGTGHDKMADQVNVFGIKLFSDIDYREINGVVAVEEPCLRGYERIFDALGLVIGYGFDKKIRRISTRNSNTSMFGVKPGMALEEGKKIILQAGFNEYAPPVTFRADKYILNLLVDGDKKIFGLTLQSVD